MHSIICIAWILASFYAKTDAFYSAGPSRRSVILSAIGSTKKGARSEAKYHKSVRRKGANSRKRPDESFIRSPNQTPKLRPILNDYDANRNVYTNKQRLVQDIGCPHFNTCSGCTVSSRVDSVDTIQSARLFFSSNLVRRYRLRPSRIDDQDDDSISYPVIVPSSLTQWRTQAKLAVAPKSSSWAKDGCTLGLFAQGTHDVMSIPDCQVHHPAINRAVALLEQASAMVGTPAFTGKRDLSLRYVQFQVERTTNKVCLTLIWNAEALKDTHPQLTLLTKELQRLDPKLWHSMWCHCNDSPGNNIFSRNPKRWHHLSGPEFVREPLSVGDFGWLYFSPLNFRQANMDGFDILAQDVAKAVPGSSRKAVESLPGELTGRDQGGKRGKEEEEETMTLAQLAALMESGKLDSTKPKPKSNGDKTSYLVADAAKALQSGQALGANVLIVDPPRKGLEPAVLSELCKPINCAQPYAESANALVMIPDDRINWVNDVDTLIYVSCGFDALARDTEELLTSNAGWMIESSTGYVLFPGSNHVETLCILKRKLT